MRFLFKEVKIPILGIIYFAVCAGIIGWCTGLMTVDALDKPLDKEKWSCYMSETTINCYKKQ